MSILKRSADLVYTFRFLKLLTTDFEDTEAFKLGLIDSDGKSLKKGKPKTREEKSAYTPFHRLVFNIKKLLAQGPGRGKIASYVAALFLLKENYGLTDSSLEKIMAKSNVDVFDVLKETTQWFVVENQMLSPGVYRLRNDKVINTSCDELVKAKDQVRISEGCYPVDELFGMSIYEGIHLPTLQKIYLTTGELYK